jgi:hypothetical protein
VERPILGATSGGAALTIARLRPGTIIIDDSFPVSAHAITAPDAL